MKKYKKFAYIALIILIGISAFFLYNNVIKKQSEDDVKSKTLSEVKHLENKFVDFFNQLNNITYETYKISSTDIKASKKENESQTSQDSESGSSGGKSESKSSGSASSSSGGSNEAEGESTSSSEDNEKYEFERISILTQEDSEPNWDLMKNEIEDMYTSLYSTTLDLYETSNNQENILNFNKEYDNLTMAVNDESKEDTLMELTLLYDYLPDFIESCTEEKKEKILVQTKNYIFKAYSALDQEEWESISENISKAVNEFTKLVTNINNTDDENQYTINKVYIMINELQNTVALQNKELFLIKYKNILEELEKI